MHCGRGVPSLRSASGYNAGAMGGVVLWVGALYECLILLGMACMLQSLGTVGNKGDSSTLHLEVTA